MLRRFYLTSPSSRFLSWNSSTTSSTSSLLFSSFTNDFRVASTKSTMTKKAASSPSSTKSSKPQASSSSTSSATSTSSSAVKVTAGGSTKKSKKHSATAVAAAASSSSTPVSSASTSPSASSPSTVPVGKTVIETTHFTETQPHNSGTHSQETPEEVTSFLNQFQYAGAELGLKLAPPDLAIELLDYQKEGVGWMARREHFHAGGIMADFLGMGKTVQLLALCVARQPNPKLIASSAAAAKKQEQRQQQEGASGEKSGVDTNNVRTNSSTHHSTNSDEVTRAIVEQQKKVDRLAFTTHGEPFKIQTVIQQLLQIPAVMNVSKITMPAKDVFSLQRDLAQIVEDHPTAKEEDIDKRLAVIRKELDKWLTFAGKYYASWEKRARTFLAAGSEESDPNAADLDTPEIRTLVIVPASLVFQWKHEIETKIDQIKRPCKTLIYHGSATKADSVSAIDLETQDFVITTYESVVRAAVGAFKLGEGIRKRTSISQESMGAQMFNRAAAGPLFKVRWKRIILDEAHYVRNERTTRFRCIQQLMGVKRWAVTATPLHNSIQDLQTLLTFVGQPRLPLFEANEALLLKDPVLQRAIARSLQPAFLRRTPIMTRQGVEQTLLVLPSKDDSVIRGDLTHKEVLLYNDSLAKRQSALSFIAGKSFIHVFAMMTLLRQACCHPWLTEGKKSEHQVCFLCNFETLNPIVTRCGHAFCKECLHMAFKAHAGDRDDETVRLPCPACQVPIPLTIFGKTLHLSHQENISRLRKRNWVSSSKVDMLLDTVKNVLNNKPDEKIVVFAQFTSLLDIVTVALEKTFPNMAFVRIDGSLNLKARNGLIHSFTYQKDVKVLLASKMAMGVGLNLTAANNVIILDPWWNPQVEEQAVHRCHRIGQKKHVTVQRFVMNDTIEQYCYEISRKKKDFGDAVLKAATAEENDHYQQSTAKTVAQLIAKELKPIGNSTAATTTVLSSGEKQQQKPQLIQSEME